MAANPVAKSVTIDGTPVGPIGYGLMGLTWHGEVKPIDEAVAIVHHAYNRGARLWNAGEFYGKPDHNSLHILRAYFDKYPEHLKHVRVSIKGAADPLTITPQPTEEGIRASISRCKAILGDIPIDIFEAARFDPEIPVETTLNALKKVHSEGLIGGVSLSEASARTVEVAHQILGDALKTVEVELSLFTLDPFENGVAAACKKYNLPLTGYSPLGRGFLAGKFKTEDQLTPFHKMLPRFQGEAFKLNLRLVDAIHAIAKAKGCTAAQVAIGWVIAQSGRDGNPDIIPIPGASSTSRVDENMVPVPMSDKDLAEIDALLKQFPTVGGRYPDAHIKFTTV